MLFMFVKARFIICTMLADTSVHQSLPIASTTHMNIYKILLKHPLNSPSYFLKTLYLYSQPFDAFVQF